ncbi:uncharacterized protein PGTG_02496 [Puccinia graminis f. sp. tritici CRL 75-36-700-3]|uniref:SNF2 N-terminal domain-containing protein n=1 Tax=Puccinia graminis f. sp. tritici (strain CRL 75-36-700-3 / race SCCL) TaxID=418459 RepID=E3JVI0_PUCGT|nr:uncharacterized protein PGTG_02496 [Puccinia graminis f. sp. tritici CRL 75-36-700-3]EFP76055.2 hypothetical protein PGTG_02496 [Puccinia graminis f. sp. tritici CRL 75-36-700-3]
MKWLYLFAGPPPTLSASLRQCQTNLKSHQLSALSFLLRNEHPNNNTKDLWYHDDNAWLRHYFDEESVSSETEPPEDDRSQGSILADDMGLGKTLTTLVFSSGVWAPNGVYLFTSYRGQVDQVDHWSLGLCLIF